VQTLVENSYKWPVHHHQKQQCLTPWLVVLLFFFGGPLHKIKGNNVKTGSLHQGINVKTCKQPFHGLVVFGPIIEALY